MISFREHLFNTLNEVNLDDKEETVLTMQWLAKELIQYHFISIEYEKKLMELMTAKDFEEFSEVIGKELFKQELDMMQNEEFKQFCMDNFEKIVEDTIDDIIEEQVMFLPATCDKEPCLVNMDFIVEIYDMDKPYVKAYTMESDFPYYIAKEDFDTFFTTYYIELEAEEEEDEPTEV